MQENLSKDSQETDVTPPATECAVRLGVHARQMSFREKVSFTLWCLTSVVGSFEVFPPLQGQQDFSFPFVTVALCIVCNIDAKTKWGQRRKMLDDLFALEEAGGSPENLLRGARERLKRTMLEGELQEIVTLEEAYRGQAPAPPDDLCHGGDEA